MNEMLKDYYAVKVKNLSRKFGNFTAVNDISFDVKKGEVFGFLGANGAGKTTTIKMLSGLLKPTSGEGYVCGLDINSEYEKIKNYIGYMSQRFSLYNDLNVDENLFFFGGIYGLNRDKVEKRIRELKKVLQLENILKQRTGAIPPGFRQRLALGCAILHKPEIIFLDEPTSGVDPIARRYFWDLISHLTTFGTTVFITTHYMDEAEYCHRLSIMYKGKIVELDTPESIKKKYNMKSIEEIFISLVDKKGIET